MMLVVILISVASAEIVAAAIVAVHSIAARREVFSRYRRRR